MEKMTLDELLGFMKRLRHRHTVICAIINVFIWTVLGLVTVTTWGSATATFMNTLFFFYSVYQAVQDIQFLRFMKDEETRVRALAAAIAEVRAGGRED